MNFKELIEQLKINEAIEREMSSRYKQEWENDKDEIVADNRVKFSFAMELKHEAAEDAYHNAVNQIEEWYKIASVESYENKLEMIEDTVRSYYEVAKREAQQYETAVNKPENENCKDLILRLWQSAEEKRSAHRKVLMAIEQIKKFGNGDPFDIPQQ